jgi:hypothetical protein
VPVSTRASLDAIAQLLGVRRSEAARRAFVHFADSFAAQDDERPVGPGAVKTSTGKESKVAVRA